MTITIYYLNKVRFTYEKNYAKLHWYLGLEDEKLYSSADCHFRPLRGTIDQPTSLHTIRQPTAGPQFRQQIWPAFANKFSGVGIDFQRELGQSTARHLSDLTTAAAHPARALKSEDTVSACGVQWKSRVNHSCPPQRGRTFPTAITGHNISANAFE